MDLTCAVPRVPPHQFPDPEIDVTAKDGEQTAVLAGGCFWCVEAVLKELNGVLEVTSGYSGGTAHPPFWSSTVRTQRMTVSGSAPLSMLLPHSTVSGRSVTSRMVTLATRKMQHSSCTVPLSLRTQKALRSSAMKSKSPKGSQKRICRCAAASTLKRSMTARVRGCVLQIIGSPYSRCKASSDWMSERSLSSTSTFSARCIVTRKYPPAATSSCSRISEAAICAP